MQDSRLLCCLHRVIRGDEYLGAKQPHLYFLVRLRKRRRGWRRGERVPFVCVAHRSRLLDLDLDLKSDLQDFFSLRGVEKTSKHFHKFCSTTDES